MSAGNRVLARGLAARHDSGMARVYVALFFLELVLAVVSLISCLSADEGDLRGLPRLAWVFVILLFPLLGSITYLLAGRPQNPATAGAGAGAGWRLGGVLPDAGRPAPGRTVAPDDDPEFLRRLDRQAAREDQERLRRWEEDLRRRENELRKRDPAAGDSGLADG
jgi:hypothetical protein